MTGILARFFAVAACGFVAFGSMALPSAAAEDGPAWTFAMYMCSDNDLDYWGQVNIDWLKSVGSTDDVKFVVLWDTSTGPANLWLVEKHSTVRMADFKYDGVETNMGDPEVLESLVDYLGSEFGSENLLIDLWNHGDDFRGICFDHDTGTEDALDYLTHQEIGDALSGKPVSVIAADGCGLGIIEASYEYVVRGVTAEWFVASENYVPLQGFPYETIGEDLVSDPGMSPKALSKVIVERYAEFYNSGWLTELAAIRLAEIRDVVDQLWDVTAILSNNMAIYRGLVASGRAQATMGWSQYGWEAYVDFPTIFEVISKRAPAGSALKAEAKELLMALEVAVPFVGPGYPAEVWGPEGLSVFFPPSHGSFKHNVFWKGSLYPTMQFAQDGWLDFLHSFYGI